jgi:hypothetical protein
MDSGTEDSSDIAAMIDRTDFVDARLALVRLDDAWQVRHGEVTLGAAASPKPRTWRYANDAFLETRVPGHLAAGLLRPEGQEIDGLKVTAPASLANGIYQRVAGGTDWRPAIMPWPRTQWEIQAEPSATSREGGLLVGDGPSFVSHEAAFSAFFYGAAPSNMANQQPLWRIIQIDRRAWLHQIKIFSDALTVVVKGTALNEVALELCTPTSRIVRRVGRTGRLKLRLPRGLAANSLLLLRQGDEWLDYRNFYSSTPGGDVDPSVIWHQPEAELALLIAGGEGQRVEFKQEVPMTESSRKTVLKTIAAFASSDGGTMLFGVADDTQVLGIDATKLDGLKLAIVNMIRNSIDPEPSYRLRDEQLDGRTLLVLEITAGYPWYTVNPAKPEFYVRRGASTSPARKSEIAAGFRHQTGSGLQW